MKILHITYSWKPGRSGILNYVDNLTQCQKKKHDVFVMHFYPFLADRGYEYVENGVAFIMPEAIEDPSRRNEPRLHYDNPALEEKILDRAKRLKPDIVHVQTCYGISSGIIPLLEKSGFKTIVHLHDYLCFCPKLTLFFEDSYEHCHQPAEKCVFCLDTKKEVSDSDFKKRLAANLDNYNSSSKIIAVSQFTADIAVRLGLNKELISVVINGVDSGMAANRRSASNAKSGSHAMRFVHISPCSPMKGVIHLVNAFKDLPEVKQGKISLSIHGAKSMMMERMLKLADGIPGIRVYPPYTYEQFGSIMDSSDVAILPSLWWDTFPLTVFECMAYGVPVIGSRESGMSEAIIDGFNGFLINPHDLKEIREKVLYLYKNPEIVLKLKGNIARSDLRTFDNVAEDIIRVYHSILN